MDNGHASGEQSLHDCRFIGYKPTQSILGVGDDMAKLFLMIYRYEYRALGFSHDEQPPAIAASGFGIISAQRIED